MKNANVNSNHDQWRPNYEVITEDLPDLIDQARIHFANQIARRAYFLYLGDGAQHGHDVAHWHQAETELFRERNGSAAEHGASMAEVPTQKAKQDIGYVL